jgi:hypothetical protein
MASLFALLDHEWDRIGPDATLARQHPDLLALAGAGTLAEIVQRERRMHLATRDRLHTGIVARATAGDHMATRLELQLLLPGTVALAARFWSLGDSDERASAAVAAVYQSILRYNVERRTHYVGPNIVAAAAQQLRRLIRQPHPQSISRDYLAPRLRDDMPDSDEGLHPAEELLDVLCDAVTGGVVSRADAQLIASTRIGSGRLADIAHSNGTSQRSLQRRRQRAERALQTMEIAA